MSGPIKREVFPCHRLRSLSLFHVPRKNLYFFCMQSMQQLMRTVAVTLGVQRCLLTGSRLIKVERTSLAQPESYTTPLKARVPRDVPSMAVDPLLHFHDSVVHMRPLPYTSLEIRT